MYIGSNTIHKIGAGAGYFEQDLRHPSKAWVPGETTQHYYELCHAEK